jgi:hypothetical protein
MLACPGWFEEGPRPAAQRGVSPGGDRDARSW